jgi:hypothetical protein
MFEIPIKTFSSQAADRTGMQLSTIPATLRDIDLCHVMHYNQPYD